MLTATVCIALSGAGLAVSFLTAWRRRFLRATRIAAWSLLPVGLYMTGLLPLGQKVGKAVGTWASDLVFKPTVWAGVGVLALAVVLFVVTRIAGRRSGVRSGGGSREVTRPGGAPAVAPSASTAALGPGGRTEGTSGAKQGKRKAGADDGLSDFKDVEEILRRHGI